MTAQKTQDQHDRRGGHNGYFTPFDRVNFFSHRDDLRQKFIHCLPSRQHPQQDAILAARRTEGIESVTHNICKPKVF